MKTEDAEPAIIETEPIVLMIDNADQLNVIDTNDALGDLACQIFQ